MYVFDYVPVKLKIKEFFFFNFIKLKNNFDKYTNRSYA